MRKTSYVLMLALCTYACLKAADVPSNWPDSATVRDNSQFAKLPDAYYWQAVPVGNSARLLVLFCHSCRRETADRDIPLIAVLKDTLGDSDRDNDRVTYVWLLSHSRPAIGQRILAAIPFFYWRVADGSAKVGTQDVRPFMNLAAPQHPVLASVRRDLLQWTVLDPMMSPIRATSRAYRSNEVDHERLHIEEAIRYLRQAPASTENAGLNSTELSTLTARLELRKRLLGGLVERRDVARVGEEVEFEEERIRSRNWEVLRQSAEKTGLLFEPLDLAASNGEYGILWFPLQGSTEPAGTSLEPLWKLLNIKNPWRDSRLNTWTGPAFTRSLDQNGTLLPQGQTGAQTVELVPLGIYSMNYPKLPLLLVDFRDTLHVRRHEMTQRTINEITSGVIGISHFTNWYYYLGADLYDFVRARHGAAMDQDARLDSYSRFRVDLALDASTDPRLRAEMQKHVESLSVNPLEVLPEKEMQAALARYDILRAQAEDGKLVDLLNQERRSELASFGQSRKWQVTQAFLHMATLGKYTPRVKPDPDNLAALDRNRRLQTNLDFLNSVAQMGTQPEVAFDRDRIAAAVNEVSSTLPQIHSGRLQTQAQATLTRLKDLTHDSSLETDCLFALDRMKRTHGTGIAAKPREISVASTAR